MGLGAGGALDEGRGQRQGENWTEGRGRRLVAQMVKNPPASAGDLRDAGSVPRLGRSPGVGHGSPTKLQYSCLEESMDRGA